jgi:hypothetical protein
MDDKNCNDTHRIFYISLAQVKIDNGYISVLKNVNFSLFKKF